MSYTIDIYRKKQSPYDSFLDFACYAAFFPQLVAGPIVRADHFRKEIERPVQTNPYRFRLGLTLIIYGIAKKAFVIADNVAVHANAIFVEGDHLANIGLIWWATLCFGIQIYCDFSARIPILRLGLPISLAYAFPRTSRLLMLQLRLRISGVDGIFHSRLGYVIISTSLSGFKKWAETDDFCINDDDVVGRFMAWSFMEFRYVGVRSWLPPHYPSIWK